MLDNLVRMLLNVDERYREADIVHRILNYIHTLCHENKTFRRRPVAKQKGMVFGFRKTATAVTRPERQIDRYIHYTTAA